MYYNVDDMIYTNDINLDKSLTDKKSYENILIYNVAQKT